MVPESHILYSVRGGEVALHYFTARDHPWMAALVDEHDRFVGRPRRELEARLREPLPCAAPVRGVRLASLVLTKLYSSRVEAVVAPELARRAVFDGAARDIGPRAAVLSTVARELGVLPEGLVDSLFADLPGERRLRAPDQPVAASELSLRANLILVQAVLFGSSAIAIEAEGNARAVVRHAKLRGLICSIAPRGPKSDATLAISGPYSLFRRTLLYGRALAEIVPMLGWCTRFVLRAECTLRGQSLRFTLRASDPFLPATPPRRFDSRLEERFARDFRKVAPDYDVIREPEAIKACGTLIFPDFAVQHRTDRQQRWFVEIIGFWTAEYLEKKLALLRNAGVRNLIVCLDEDRNCGEADLPPGAQVVRFRRRIDPHQVLRAMASRTVGAPGP